MSPELDRPALQAEVTRALIDAGTPPGLDDIPEERTALASIVSIGRGAVAGLAVAREVFARVGVRLRPRVAEGGSPVAPATAVADLGGSVRAMLTARDTALRYLERLSAVASGAPASEADALEAWAASFWSGDARVGENGPRFELVIKEEPTPVLAEERT